jgi:hypothetical protein
LKDGKVDAFILDLGNICIYKYVYIYVHIYIFICIYIYIYIFVYMYIYIFIYIYVYIYINISGIIEKVDISPSGEVYISSSMNMKKLLTKPFRIGQLFHDMKLLDIQSSIKDKNIFLNKIMIVGDQESAAAYMQVYMYICIYVYMCVYICMCVFVYAYVCVYVYVWIYGCIYIHIYTRYINTNMYMYIQNGFWSDHWTYTLDMFESYLSVFPDKEAHLLWDSEPIPFFISPAVVKTRADRYTYV